MTVARYEAAPGIVFAMFRGGGVGFLDRAIKGKEPGVPPSAVGISAEKGTPDLSGLSCRFEPITSRGGCTVSLVVVIEGEGEDYRPVLAKIVEIAGEDLRPTSLEALAASFTRTWLPSSRNVGLELDALNLAGWWRRLRFRLAVAPGWLAAQLSLRLGTAGFRRELEEKVRNSDFAKADDALQMVIDCTPDQLARIESYLAELEVAGILSFGLHVSDSALMTCLVDSADGDWHVHFIDGAGGGYTQAAKAMKDKVAERRTRAVAAEGAAG